MFENQKILNYNINGRKIPSNFENPFDNIIIMWCDYFINFCIKYKITPNIITIARIFLSFYIYYILYYTVYVNIPIFGIGIFYFMDCLDGHLARISDQVTVLGDYLDHNADLFFYINFLIYMLYRNYLYKCYILFLFFILTYLSLVHLSLQQYNYKIIIYDNLNISEKNKIFINDCESLDILKFLHNFKPSNIKWSRYFGTGTLYLNILFIVYWINNYSI
jgi:phosphatidylglycerophosphate synthase